VEPRLRARAHAEHVPRGDYWNIEKKDAIGTVTADAILANPNDRTLYNRYISRFHRSPIGTTLYVDQPLENLGDLKTSGWDVDAKVRFDSGFGRFTVGLVGTYVSEYKQQLGPGFPMVSYLGNSFNGGNAYPKWQHAASWTTSAGPGSPPWSRPTPTAGRRRSSRAARTRSRASRASTSALKWSGIKDVSFKLGVRNVMDDLPPYTDVSSNGSHAAGWANAVGDPAAGSGTDS
jgi:iron complex outermembrane receptor protein